MCVRACVRVYVCICMSVFVGACEHMCMWGGGGGYVSVIQRSL